MIAYFIKSFICLALLLAFYHLVLEREKMHQFNRFYLLGSILFSFVAPLYKIYIEVAQTIAEDNQPLALDYPIPTEIIEPVQETNYMQYALFVYLIISLILTIRFIKNLVAIYLKTKQHKKIKKGKATLVLVNDLISPHTFWNYIFINKEEYYSNKIETELYTHELTHALQKHTFDILLIELLQIIFWINPTYILLKKAVKLNHEFLADNNVITTHKNTSEYQYLLLNRAAWNNEYYLASNLNYLLTKKRLLMMTKQSSRTKILFKKLAVIPVLAGFTFLFAERIEASEKKSLSTDIKTNKTKINVFKSIDSIPKTDKTVNRKEATFTYTKKNGEVVSKKLSELTKEEKKMVPPPPPVQHKKKKWKDVKYFKNNSSAVPSSKQKTGFYEGNGQKLYYVQKGEKFTFYNKYGQIVTKEGKIINPEQTASDKVIPGQNITKIYKDDKVVTRFKNANLPPPPPKANFPEVKKGEESNIPPPAPKVKKGEYSNIPPPPPPISAEELVNKYPNAIYYFNNKKVSYQKALRKVKKEKNLKVLTQLNKTDKIIRFTTKDYVKKGWKFINNQTLFYIIKKGKTEYFNRWGNKVDKNGKELQKTVTINKIDDLSNDEILALPKHNNNEPKYYLEGKLISKEDLTKIDSKKIKSINVKKEKDGSGSLHITLR